MAARALLALVLLAGVYLLAAVSAVLWVILAVLSVELLAHNEQFNTQPALFAAALLVPVGLLLLATIRASRPAGRRKDSVAVPQADAPRLWAEVAALAAAVDTAPPDEILLVPEVNALVSDDRWLLGLRRGRRRLYIGAPLLVGLRPDELQAVVAHELGHFAGRHARFSVPAARGADALMEAREAIARARRDNGLIRGYGIYVQGPVACYSWIVNRLVLPIRRRQEREADRVAASVVGPDALADGLCSLFALAGLWASFRARFVEPYCKAAGAIPDDPFHAFASMLHDPDCGRLLQEARALAVDQPALPNDTHPPLGERVAGLRRRRRSGAARVLWDPSVPALSESLFKALGDAMGAVTEPRPAPGWLGAVPSFDAAGLFGPGRDTFSSSTDGPDIGLLQYRRVPWRDWLGDLAAHRAERSLRALARAVRTLDPGPVRAAGLHQAIASNTATTNDAAAPSLRTVLGLFDAGKADDLAQALAREESVRVSTVQARAGLAAAVSTLIGHALVARGTGACWVMGWTGPSRFIAADVAAEDIAHWVSTAVENPIEVDRLRLQIHSLGIDETTVTLSEPPRRKGRKVDLSAAVPSEARSRRLGVASVSAAVAVVIVGVGAWLHFTAEKPSPFPPSTRYTVPNPLNPWPTDPPYRWPVSPAYPVPGAPAQLWPTGLTEPLPTAPVVPAPTQ
ncbi:M48 family metalloprotease [Dactylosporangium matsuzakiense]|uniref:Peptidase M48 domain-containing protein n=1 Tax=Dactylosporangium matsuzakiense TaxID=53360 RepID=A0A9W6NN45_9ACTN|nr:M48 family metallopeptidase [Dactylosporangium matsuzakiense]GLL02848.1 hypothetical protein GCM10017581_045900 [Dactylosporangium matsuzakiense]